MISGICASTKTGKLTMTQYIDPQKINALLSRMQRDLKKNTGGMLDKTLKKDLKKVMYEFITEDYLYYLKDQKTPKKDDWMTIANIGDGYASHFVTYCKSESDYSAYTSFEMEKIMDKHCKEFALVHYGEVAELYFDSVRGFPILPKAEYIVFSF